MSTRVAIHMSIHMSTHMSRCMSMHISIHISIHMSIRISTRVALRMSIRISTNMSIAWIWQRTSNCRCLHTRPRTSMRMCTPTSVHTAARGHNYIGHNHVGHDYIGHNYTQLPPTNFFEAAMAQQTDDVEEFESILHECLSANIRRSPLTYSP